MNLKGKVVAITGGGRGIGLTIAEALAESGAKVAIGARTQKELDQALASLKAKGPGPHLALACDVRDTTSLSNFSKTVNAELGTPFGVVAAAGVYGEISPFLESSLDEWESSLDINVMGVVRTVQVFAKAMKATGGRIVLFSGGGQAAMPNFAPYVTAKGGLWRFTETVGKELAAHKIYLNALAPGAVNTKFLDDLLSAGPDKVGKEIYDRSLKQRDGGGESPLKAAKLVQYLLSDKADGIYGRTLSAVWDDYEKLSPAISRTDVYTYKRVVREDGQTKS